MANAAHEALREEVEKLNETNDILMKENAQLGERIQDLEDELAAITQDRAYLRELETTVKRLRERIAELEDDR